MDEQIIQPALGKRLRRAREQAGLTQTETARRAEITGVYLNYLEAGTSWPSLHTLARIATVLDIPVADLLKG